jgi:predicted O-methyltransferase YrrM
MSDGEVVHGLEVEATSPLHVGTQVGTFMRADLGVGVWKTLTHHGDEGAAGVTDGEAQLLYGLVRALRPQTVLEWGTGYGWSGLHIAAALEANGQGMLYTLEIDPTRVEHAKRYIGAAGLAGRVEFRTPPPPQLPYEFIYLDAEHDVDGVRRYLRFCRSWLAPQGCVLVHDALWIDHVRQAADGEWSLVELRTDSEAGMILMQPLRRPT